MKEKINGLGGWLIILQIGFILNILISAFILIFSSELIVIISCISIILLKFFSLYLMYEKKKIFPKVAIFTMWCSFILSIVYSFTISATLLTGKNIFLGLIFPVVWTLYLVESERVKNTFVN